MVSRQFQFLLYAYKWCFILYVWALKMGINEAGVDKLMVY
uniref:Uncharacterized protein n=1 Tax=Rhizophora mucronata TaxID=61149 RepID=A0A2P2PVR3_RHIMU